MEHHVEFTASGEPVQHLYTNPMEFESAVLFMRGKSVVLECGLTVHVRRWSVAQSKELGGIISRVVATLFPDDLLFLAHNDFMNVMSSDEKFNHLYAILMEKVLDEVKALVRLTLGSKVYDAEVADGKGLEDFLTFSDYLLIVATIIEQEINNPLLIGLLKKVMELFRERSPLPIL